jgi:hypothetical protein
MLLVLPATLHAGDAPAMGLNKFELFEQYLGLKRVYGTATNAIQSMDDAKKYGFRYMRINAGGYCASDFAGWQQDPDTWWSAFDQMVADASARGIALIPDIAWNEWAFPDLAGEPLAKLFDTTSKTNQLVKQYASQLVSRYKNNPAILFWELGNELNLGADLDQTVQAGDSCNKGAASAADDYTTDQMIAYVADLAAFIKSIDPHHQISSGYSRPRPYAQHLRASPQWLKADFTRDSFSQMESYLRDTYPANVDLISVHMYPSTAATPDWTISDLQKAAANIGKPMFVGEFGQYDANGNWETETPFVDNVLAHIMSARTPYSAPWRWESLKPGTPPVPNLGDIEPSVNQGLIDQLNAVNRQLQGRNPRR